MKIRVLITAIALLITISNYAQQSKTPVTIHLKNGESVEAIHFGQLKCGTDVYSNDYVIIRGKYMDTVTEIDDYSSIEKIILEGFNKAPIASVGNEKATVRIFRKNGVSVSLSNAEIAMSCYGAGDKYNEITVQIMNPITDKIIEHTIPTKDIQSVIFK